MAKKEFVKTYGAEIEKPIADILTGDSHGVSQGFFELLRMADEGAQLKHSDIQPETIIGVHSPSIGDQGLDNAWNLQETASNVTTSLEELEGVLQTDLAVIQTALEAEGATVINLSSHPLVLTNAENYKAYVAPKGVYEYILARGWDHQAGIDAKAQNSPATSVRPEDAARAVTTIIGSGAAIVGIFGNSPFSEQRVSEYKESRLQIWDRMMKHSISEGDRKTAVFPDAPFESLKDYFNWMFGDGTNIHFVLAQNADYKTFGDAALLVDGNPSVMSYLNQPEVVARFLKTKEQTKITPHLSHLEVMQFAQFAGARIRWQFNHDEIDIPSFLTAYKTDNLEELFANGGVNYTYIEGRDPGAIFPDQQLLQIDPIMAKTAIMSPSALQAGLLQNLDEAHQYISSIPWKQLELLRTAAIRDGLNGRVGELTVADFAARIVDIAAKGLSHQDQRLLAYPEFVLHTGMNGADRALEQYENGESIPNIIKSRKVIIDS